MKKCTVFFILALTLLIAKTLEAQTAMFGVNPQHSGVYQSDFPSELNLVKKWKFKTNGKIFSSAAVLNDVIYFGSDDSCLYALDNTGSQKWKFKSNGKICSTPAVKDSVIYFNNYGGMFYAVNTKTGKEVWSFKTDGESPRTGKGLNWCTPKDMVMADPWDFYLSSPVIADSRIYFGSGATVYAINLETKELIWKYTAPDIIHSTPAISDGMIYFGCWDSKLYALNLLTGTLVWSFQSGLDPVNRGMEGIQSSPSVVDSLVIIGSRDANVYALHAKTGKKIWMQGFGGSWMPSSFAIANKTVYTGSSDGKRFFSLDLKNGEINYSTNTSLFTFSTPAIANQLAFIGVMNGSLMAIDLTSGTIIGKFDTGGRLLNPLKAIKSDGTLNDEVFKDLNGSDYSLNVEYVRRILTAGSILSTPVLDKNVVYFGSTDSCFYAVQDAGGCKPKFKVSTSMVKSINPVGTMLDTVLYVSNMSDCIDSVKIYAAPSSYLTANSFEIKPSSFNTLPNDSVRVHIKVNTTGLKPGKTYSFKIISQSKTNEYYLFNTDISLRTTSPTTAISQIDEKTADVIYPNPFSDFTVLKYTLDRNCFVNVRIYNSAGQMMAVLVDQNQKIGEYSVVWDGKNCEGAKLKPGIYICSIKKGNSLTSKEILLVD